MKRKSILVAIIIAAISLVGCAGNSKTGNNFTGNPNTSNNASGTGSTDPGNNSTTNPNFPNNASGTDGTDSWNNSTINPNAANNSTNNADTTKNATGNTNNEVINSTESVTDALRYTATDFKNDVTDAGYKLSESDNTKKNYFSGNETDYMMGNDMVRVYEYTSANDLQNDVNRISQNGLTVSGTDANFSRKPNYYRKGNSLIMYEGNEPAYTDHFKTMYGNTLIP